MPSTISRNLIDRAVYWAQSSYDDDGNPTLGSPVQIVCRWETKRKEANPYSENETIGYNEFVMTAQELTVGGIMWKGKLVDIPSPPTDLRQIVDQDIIRDIRGVVTYYAVKLVKYGNTLPNLA